jgi:hypothetical protein
MIHPRSAEAKARAGGFAKSARVRTVSRSLIDAARVLGIDQPRRVGG